MTDIIIKEARLSYPKIWTPEEYTKGDGRPRYGANFVVEKGSEDDKAIEASIADAAANAWGKKAESTLARLRGQKTQWCYMPYFTDGDEDDDEKEYMSLNARRQASNGRPLIIDWNKEPLDERAGRPYSGCVVAAMVSIYIQPTGEHIGVRCSFSTVQFVRDGVPFGGGASRPTADGMPDLSAPPGYDDDLV